MGNAKSSTCPINLAMMAVARERHIEQGQIVALRSALAGFADDRGIVHRKEFDRALELANLGDVEIFDLLFTMWDNDGRDEIPFKGFCVGISPLACPYDDLAGILRFALRVSDNSNLGYVRAHELQTVLNGINSTASYFGDAHLSKEELAAVLEIIFERGVYKIAHEDCIRRLVSNAYIKRFASGKARTHVQFKKDLATEISIEPRPNRDKPSSLSPRLFLENRFSPRRQRWRGYGVKLISPRSPKRQVSLFDTTPSFDECTENIKLYSKDPPSSPHYSRPLRQIASPQHSRGSRDP
ncbi:hypothetical protein IV203_008131 [Nitzschia inconspicua]|uniref:Uncharacterized protein n=1 Tax=Nitzschia inconspicua TaxID=303405 RepID=A0A9K3KZH3_9STRA|nr:hypothetical protein IV203_008131 [Nitzschia inconspicua]